MQIAMLFYSFITDLDESQLLKTAKGTIHDCSVSRSTKTGLGYNRNNGIIELGGNIITSQNQDESCHATVEWDISKANCSSSDTCKFTEVYKMKNEEIVQDDSGFSLIPAQMIHMSDDQIPESLKNKQFQVRLFKLSSPYSITCKSIISGRIKRNRL